MVKRKTKTVAAPAALAHGSVARGTTVTKAAISAEPGAPPVAAIQLADAVAGFKDRATAWHKSTIAVVASASVCLIVANFAKDGRSRHDYDDTVERLHAAVAEKGLREAQVYRYIGIARALITHLSAKSEGTIFDVLACDDEREAVDVILGYFAGEKVKSLDDAGVLVGKYQRSSGARTSGSSGRSPVGVPPTTPGRKPEEDGKKTPHENGKKTPEPGREPEPGEPAPDKAYVTLIGLQPEEVVNASEKAGIAPVLIGKAVVSMLTDLEELGMLIRLMTQRAAHLTRALHTMPQTERRKIEASATASRARRVAAGKADNRRKVAA